MANGDNGQPQGKDLHGQWSDWLGDPDNRAAMISFGASMLQPTYQRGVGGFMGQMGQALGTAGETLTGREATARAAAKEAEAEDIARRGMGVKEQEAKAYEEWVRNRGTEEKGGLTEYQRNNIIRSYGTEYERDQGILPESKKEPFDKWMDRVHPGHRDYYGIGPRGEILPTWPARQPRGAPQAPATPPSQPLRPTVPLPRSRPQEGPPTPPSNIRQTSAGTAYADGYGRPYDPRNIEAIKQNSHLLRDPNSIFRQQFAMQHGPGEPDAILAQLGLGGTEVA